MRASGTALLGFGRFGVVLRPHACAQLDEALRTTPRRFVQPSFARAALNSYKRGLENAIQRGGLEVAEYVRGYLYKPPSDGYKKLEEADSLDLACESLVQDEGKPYAHLFTDGDRAAARERLAPHVKAIEARKTERRVAIDAARAKLRQSGLPARPELDAQLRSRRNS